MIKCPNCGGELKYNPSDTVVKCNHCGSKWNPDELNVKFKFATETKNGDGIDAKSYSCTQCGAKLLTFDDTAVTFCSYCGSQAMLEEKMVKINKPDFIIPFSLSKDECIAAYKKKIKKALFVPSYMKSDVVVDKFRGIYMPYCIYNLEHKGLSHNKGKKPAYRSGCYVYYDVYDVIADVDAHCYGISYDLSSNFFDSFSNSSPYDFKDRKEYNSNYLLGYYADSLDVDSEVYDEKAKSVLDETSTKILKQYREYYFCGCNDPKLDFDIADKKIGMFPVYFLAIKNKKGDKIHYAVVNGQTGNVAVDLPIDFKKYIIGSLIITPLLFLLVNSLFFITVKKLVAFSFISGIICFIIILIQLGRIEKRETHCDDLGYTSVNKNSNNKTSSFNFIKCFISIILPLVIIIVSPANDMFYYGGSLISLLFVIWTFKDIVNEHNLMVSSKLPQLNKRGGDENE